MSYFKHTNKRGFTLVEMIVSLAIFSIVATVSLGALVSIVSANKKAQTLQSTITNLNFALESMSRDMRVGGKYHCENNQIGTFNPGSSLSPLSCDVGANNFLAFESSRKIPGPGATTCFAVIAYKFELNTATTDPNDFLLSRAEQENCNDTLGGAGSIPFTPIISPEDVRITDFAIQVTNNTYPLAFVMIAGYTGVRDREKTDFAVQTAISPRLLSGN